MLIMLRFLDVSSRELPPEVHNHYVRKLRKFIVVPPTEKSWEFAKLRRMLTRSCYSLSEDVKEILRKNYDERAAAYAAIVFAHLHLKER
jgi:hypothetical protein